MSGLFLLSIGAALFATFMALLAMRARKSLSASVVGPPFSAAVRSMLDVAQGEARARGHNQVGPEHLLLAMCHVNAAGTGDAVDDVGADADAAGGADTEGSEGSEDSEDSEGPAVPAVPAAALSLFSGDTVDMDLLRASAERIMPPLGTPSIDGIELPYTARARFALRAAVLRAGKMQRAESELDDIVAGLLAEGRNSAARVMQEAGVRL